MDDEFGSTAAGLLQCLKVLSEEAASLSLTQTFAALQDAVAICRDEAEIAPASAWRPALPGYVH